MRIISKSKVKSFILLTMLEVILISPFIYVISISLNKKTFVDGYLSIIFIIGLISYFIFKTYNLYKEKYCIVIRNNEIEFNILYNQKIEIKDLIECVLIKENKKEKIRIKHKISQRAEGEFYIEKKDVFIKLKKLEKIIKGLMVK